MADCYRESDFAKSIPPRLIFISDSSASLSDKLIISVWHFDADRWEESIPLPYGLG
jgi:hypothetical protein